MIITKSVYVKWNGKTKKYYVEKGYIFTKIMDSFEVKIEDLMKTSAVFIEYVCENCGEIKNTSYRYYIDYTKDLTEPYYCIKCKIKSEKTNLKKYGCKNPMQNPRIREKLEKTNLKKYGFKSPMQNETVKKKIIQKNLKLFGSEYFFQTEEFIKKSKQSHLKKYGVEYSLQCPNIRKKMKKTIFKKFGVENVSQNKEIKEKKIQTNLKNWGTENVFQNEKIKKKLQLTQIKKYGETFLKHIPRYNPLSIFYLDKISEETGYVIRHAANGGERKFHKYWVDGYIQELNLVIEVDEKYHKKQLEKDEERENYIKENFGCKIIRLDWENIEEEVQKLIEYLKSI
ncbi:MAG: DUF559 domain-containing protein [Candidatus Woesearchaeota archaeon]